MVNCLLLNLISFKTIDSVSNYIDIWFTDQNNRSLQMDENVNISLIVKENNYKL